MAEDQAEPFHVALSVLRERLQFGVLGPGSRITAMEVADELRLSTTPVREALSRLAGEGLVEDRRGQGYFVRALSAADIADLYRINLAYLLIALEPRRAAGSEASSADAPPEADPVLRLELGFRRVVEQAGSPMLIRQFRNLQVQLGPVRRLEWRIAADLASETAHLLTRADGAPRAEWLAQLRRFHARRIRESSRLAALLEAAHGGRRK